MQVVTLDDLRVALLIAGVVVVAGVYVFARLSRRNAARREDGREDGSESVVPREPPRKDGNSLDPSVPRGMDEAAPHGGAPPDLQPRKRAAGVRRDVGALGGMFAVRRETPDAELSVDVGILAGLRATYESTLDGFPESALDRSRGGIPDRSPDLTPGEVSEGPLEYPSGGAWEGAPGRPRGGIPDRSPDPTPGDAWEGSPDHPPGGISTDFPDRPLDGVADGSLDDSVDGVTEGSPDRSSGAVPEAPLDHPLDHPMEGAAAGSAEAHPPSVPPTAPPSRGAGEPLAVDMSRPLLYLTLVSKQEQLSGGEVLDALDAEGFRPGLLQLYYWRSDADPSIKFGVANMVEPGVLDPDALSGTETPGLVTFMSVPRDPAPAFRILDTMVAISRRLALRLDAALCDDTRSTLTAQAENHLREKIAEVLRRDRI